jgi:outer membrane protein OmpA-like peptidoglycan-associated protein
MVPGIGCFGSNLKNKERFMKARTAFFTLVLLVGAGNSSFIHGGTASQQPQNNVPVYQVRVVGNSVTAISYEHRNGATEIGFEGTPLLAQAKGEAKIESKQGRVAIDAQFKGLISAQKFGPEYLTFVLWAITPEGKTSNLGELLLNGSNSKIQVTTSLQVFGLIVSAEPYYAVNQPSNVIVLQNVVLPTTAGTVQKVTAKYELLDRGQYTYDVSSENQNIEKKTNVPLEVYEARNAVAIARSVGAQQYASDVFSKAQSTLSNAEAILARKGDRKQEIQNARDAVQNAADARQITIKRIEDQKNAQERASAAQRETQAQTEAAAASAKQQQEQAARQQAELQAQKEVQARAEADVARQQAELQAQKDAQARAEAETARQQAQQREQQQQQAAARAEQEKEQLRAALFEQFNRILPTTDTPRGLKVNLADVLFDTGKFDLRPPARERLAKFSGIVVAHPGLKLQIEGYTDTVGGDTYNQTLSENRANSVRAYLINQGIDPTAIAAVGYGKSNPVADNETVAGRQQNRRVEIIISGEIIGTQIGRATPSQQR